MRLRRILCCKKANDGFSFPPLGLVQAQNGTFNPVSLPSIFLPIYSFLFSLFNVFYEYKRKFEVIFHWCCPKTIYIWLGIWVSRRSLFGLATMLRAGQSWVQTPGVARYIFFPKRTNMLWAPPRILLNGYRSFLKGVKRPGREFNHSTPWMNAALLPLICPDGVDRKKTFLGVWHR